MLRLMPMAISGILCNFVVAFVVGRISLVNIVGQLHQVSTGII
jgi:hypothetical protein